MTSSAAPSDDPVIRVRDLTVGFGSQTVLEDLSLDVRGGEVLGVVGGSGSGKTVLLRSIIGLNHPRAGSIEVFGAELSTLPEAEREAYERRWGVLFQQGALFTSLTVSENVQVPMREHLHLPARLRTELAELKIRLAGLPADAGRKFPAELSGGMRKRAALARALALEPEILFLDEPTAGLDPISAASFDELIGALQGSLGLTVFMVTHDLDSLYTLSDRVAVLAERKVLAVDEPDAIGELDHPWVRDYFQGPRGRAARTAGGGKTSDF